MLSKMKNQRLSYILIVTVFILGNILLPSETYSVLIIPYKAYHQQENNKFSGLTCFAVGVWLRADKDIHAYFTVLHRNPGDSNLLNGVALLIVAGLLIAMTTGIGFYSVIRRNKLFMRFYLLLLFLCCILTLTAGFIVVRFKYDLHRWVKHGMKSDIKNSYMFDNAMGYAWNRVQVKRRCCGVDGPEDYLNSRWYFKHNPKVESIEDGKQFVPISCCRVNSNYDLDVTRMDPQKPAIKHAGKCQEDAAANKDISDFVNGNGCYAAILKRCHYYYNAVLGIGMGLGVYMFVHLLMSIVIAVGMQRKLSSNKNRPNLPQRY